ncbi:MAG: DinB family protein [Candidatus Eisenbacteria bacterium]
MKRVFGLCVAVAALALVMPRFTAAHDEPGSNALRQEVIASMMDAGGKIMELAGALPEKKFVWRPAKGVRSANEVFLHVIGANYMIPTLLGASTGKSMDELMKLEKSNPGKAKVEAMLKDSYDVASKAIASVPDSEMDTKVDFFGNMMTKRAIMMLLSAHSHEHLGQSIAYSRMNGVVPPWTAREMESAKKAASAKKATGGM